MYAIRSYYVEHAEYKEGSLKLIELLQTMRDKIIIMGGGETATLVVITSYSIHYTKLYEMKRMNRDTILQNRSHELFILTGQIPLCILRKGQSIAFVQLQEKSGT